MRGVGRVLGELGRAHDPADGREGAVLGLGVEGVETDAG